MRSVVGGHCATRHRRQRFPDHELGFDRRSSKRWMVAGGARQCQSAARSSSIDGLHGRGGRTSPHALRQRRHCDLHRFDSEKRSVHDHGQLRCDGEESI